MIIRPDRQPLTRLLRFIGGVLCAYLLTLGAYMLLLRPSPAASQAMALYLGTTALLSVVAGYAVIRTGLLMRLPRLQWTLLAIALLAGLLTLVNVWAPAQWSGVGQRDLTLLALLLIFAAIIAVSLSLFLAAPLSANLRALLQGAREIAHGRIATRVTLPGRDESADLGRSFNHLAILVEQAARRQRELESLRRELIAWVGHDLRTPLASVAAILAALADGVVEDPATAQRYLRTAQRDMDAVAEVVDSLFEMAQINTGGLKIERQPSSLGDLITAAVGYFERSAETKNITLESTLLPGLDPVTMDAPRIGRVLAALLDNALRHTPDSGKISVRAYPVPDGVAVDVTDTGEGIAEDDLPRVFDPFFRDERARRSGPARAGLGLAIARGIVEAHGGRIGVQSTPGKGTTVNFRIPKSIQVEIRNPLRRWRGKSMDGGYPV
ncbi:MAG: HAMP domain-containing histidine kinase [Caldilineaceae bacterium]|nr:HAMP domain-containing histidine kinase [Caldilineaceae bacterium]